MINLFAEYFQDIKRHDLCSMKCVYFAAKKLFAKSSSKIVRL